MSDARFDGRLAGALPSPTSLRERLPRGKTLVWIGLSIILGWLVVVPVALLILSSFKTEGFPTDAGFTLRHYVEAYTDPELRVVLFNTLVFTVASTVSAVALGTALAWLIERTDVPGAGVFRVLIVVPMATPPVLLATAWAMLLSPRAGSLNLGLVSALGLSGMPFNIYSMAGMVFVETLTIIPTVFLMLAHAFRNADPAHEEAAQTSGASPWRVFWRVTLPMMAPAILGAAAFVAIVCLVVFDVPGTLGMPARIFVLSSQVYYLFGASPSGVPAFGQISALAVLILACLILLAVVYQSFTRVSSRFVTISGKGFRPRVKELGPWRWVGAGLVSAYLALAVVLPLGMLVWASLMPYLTPVTWQNLGLMTISNHLAILKNPMIVTAVVNSLLVATIASTAVMALAGTSGWIIVRERGLAGRVLDILTFVPLAIPGVIMGIALTYVYLSIPVIPIYGTIWILVIAYTTFYLAYGSRTSQSAFFQLHRDLEEAGLASGASAARTHLRITFPLVFPAMLGIWVWVFAHVMRELSIALMLHGRQNVVISTLIWNYWSGGDPVTASAIGVWLIVALTLLVGATFALTRNR
ncbi:ABC transporter permease [Xanthobacter tagetidis]|uniref:Iron ABC transporter permease n=1 Tax=Xanthobacter tagetidis TaxID=60216 RepID=A0A3L7A5Q8_9HYPH|nr:iron ABC transporter permease [Xanthobacter tagetidis]MBB6309960.1 iron(III) transport system permease protein [Xanthobacter tagetidis]RLP74672.1 iron ABC transporter permease [Xanthobacter tagetidis]